MNASSELFAIKKGETEDQQEDSAGNSACCLSPAHSKRLIPQSWPMTPTCAYIIHMHKHTHHVKYTDKK